MPIPGTLLDRLQSVVKLQATLTQADFDPAQFMQFVVSAMQQLTQAKGAVIELVDGDCMIYRCASEALVQHVGLSIPRAGSLSGLCVDQGKAIRCDDTETDPRVDREACRRIGARSMICVPLFREAQVVGVLKVMSDSPSGFDDDDLYTLDLLADVLGAALGERILLDALQQQEEHLRESLAYADTRADKLADINRELEAFAYTASHDLRAPLHRLIGFTEILGNELAGKLTSDQRLYLDRIIFASKHMATLIDGVLSLSRVDYDDLQRVDVDISTLATEILRELSQNESGRTVDWQVEPDLTAFADQGMVDMVLNNLLRNAWKYTAKTASPRIRVQQCLVGTQPGFCVADNGAGFDTSKASELFRPFKRFHASEDFPGTGVGLATVWRIIKRHGGEISVESQPYNGATFRFYFGVGQVHSTM